MLQTFEDNLADATKKEKDTKASFDTLMEAKNSQLSAAQDALSGGEGEGAARTLAADEAQEEVDALTTQVSNDEKYISQAEASYADKVAEWKERKRLRTEEIASISKAIEILASDDAKDLMSSSFKSQGNFFLQEHDKAAGCKQKRATKVVHKLRDMAAKHSDPRLSQLAVNVHLHAKGHFDKIVAEVMKMVSDLHEEADEDLKTKETCEADRMSNTKTAKKSAQAMDDETALINRKKADIESMNKEIAEIVAHVKELKLQLEEAQIQRAKENREYKAAKADDEAAAVLIGKAADVLAKFYEDNGLVLAQTNSHKSQLSQPGAAPPPPPTTWQEPYGGAKGANNGIMSILEMVKADVEKDIKTATAEEAKAKSEYETFKSETETMISSLELQKSDLEAEVGDAEQAVVDAKKTRADKKKVLDDTMAFLRSIATSCDYMAVNFELRKANREAEIDGLIEAGAAMEGGTFEGTKFLQNGETDDSC